MNGCQDCCWLLLILQKEILFYLQTKQISSFRAKLIRLRNGLTSKLMPLEETACASIPKKALVLNLYFGATITHNLMHWLKFCFRY